MVPWVMQCCILLILLCSNFLYTYCTLLRTTVNYQDIPLKIRSCGRNIWALQLVFLLRFTGVLLNNTRERERAFSSFRCVFTARFLTIFFLYLLHSDLCLHILVAGFSCNFFLQSRTGIIRV